MTLKDLEVRIDQLVEQAQAALRNAHRDTYSSAASVPAEQFYGLRASSLAFIESAFGREHSFYTEFNAKATTSYEYDSKRALGILQAIRDQIRGGWMETTKGLVTAEVFADFLEMAEHLLEQKYKDPAAVLTGSVLEEHLRQLCSGAGVPVEDAGVPRKADALNSDLAKAGKYSKLDQKQITAWLDLRNRAAHGKYSEYTHDQVGIMLSGVREFASRVRP